MRKSQQIIRIRNTKIQGFNPTRATLLLSKITDRMNKEMFRCFY